MRSFWPKICIAASVAFVIAACDDDYRETIARTVEQWQGRTVQMPEGAVFTVQARDTVAMDMYAPAHKVLVYVDSTGCTSCRLQLHEWKKFIAEVDSATDGRVPFLFFLSPKSVEEAHFITRRDDFTYPICVDMQNRLDSLNRFPEEDMFHTFLLDGENRVAVIGNPIHNRSVRNLYMKTLTGRDTEKSVNTIIEVPVHELDLGILAVGEEKTVSFTLRNRGDRPLIILDVVTSCGCTAATFEKEPVKPSKETAITVTYTAEEAGMFNKSITVYANTDDSPIKLRIKGEVKG
ncbi:MAG: DUF1573 domain-containing protein [Bacteroidaceae bacterium]|nr:DUF1573 domain-containing protein [Bacteroidaceae bacterium]